MAEDKPLINRVAQSGLITIDLEKFFPGVEMVELDLKDYLFRELLLKEKDFRESVKAYDWEQLEGKVLLVYCTTDAIIPMWAYMLVASHAAPYAADVFKGTQAEYLNQHYRKQLAALPLEDYRDQKLVIKGCGDRPVPAAAYLEITRLLRPVAKSIMYGEPCSTVPIFKKPRVKTQ